MAEVSGPKILSLILRVLAFVMLLVSLIILIKNKDNVILDHGDHDNDDGFPSFISLGLKEFQAYQYMLATISLGIAYTLLQIAPSIYHVIMVKYKGNHLFDFYDDKIVSCMLGTGTAAGCELTVGMKSKLPIMHGYGEDPRLFHPFYSRSYISCSCLLTAFVATAISSVFSLYLLPKKVIE